MRTRYFSPEAGADTPESSSRRFLLKTSGLAGAALVVGFWSVPQTSRAARPVQTFRADAFLTIGSDDSITMTVLKVEMGQGIYTAIPMLIAEELEVDMDRIIVRHAPPDDQVYGGPTHDQRTGGSRSIRTLWTPMRQTGAAARIVLIHAAAEQWRVAPDTCHAEHGEVVHESSGRRLKYGMLVVPAAKITPPAEIPLKSSTDFKLIGRSWKRLDSKGKTDGSALYGIDTVLPGMVFASVAACPVFGGTLKSVDDRKARALPGVRNVISLRNSVAVVADNNWYARQGIAALDIEWDEGANAKLKTEDLNDLMVQTLKRSGVVARNDGDALKMIAADPRRVEAV